MRRLLSVGGGGPALFVLLALLLIGNNASYLFGAELYENGDMACNSMAVLRAKGFHQLTGNYSRWGFHHPGPAFFYCYALGEWLLYDSLHLVPTPYNAQLIVASLLAAFFLAASLSIMRRELRSATFLPVAALGLTLYLCSVGPSLVQDNWPPFVLAMPFLGLLVAGAGVAGGNPRDLTVLALAGGFLVHGHVAQVLFVVPASALALAALLRSGRSQGMTQFALIAFVFCLPLALDACYYPDSNLRQIVNYLQTPHEQKSWGQAIAYSLRFAVPQDLDPQAALMIDPKAWLVNTLGYGLNHPGMMAIWLCLTLAVCRHTPKQPFLRWLLAFLTLEAALSVLWNRLQAGDMYYFNSWFCLALFLGLILAACAVVARRLDDLPPRATAAVLLLLALFVFLARGNQLRQNVYADPESRQLGRSTLQALQGVRRELPVYLNVDIRDDASANALPGVALLLARQGQAFRLPTWAYFSIGESYVLDMADPRVQHGELPLWRIASTPGLASADQPALPLTSGVSLETSSSKLSPAAGNLTFKADGNCWAFVAGGWGEPQTWGRASVTRVCMIDFEPMPTDQEVKMTIFALPMANRTHSVQRAALYFDGKYLGQAGLTSPTKTVVVLPAELWNRQHPARITMRFLDVPDEATTHPPGTLAPVAPGWVFNRVEFRLATPKRPPEPEAPAGSAESRSPTPR